MFVRGSWRVHEKHMRRDEIPRIPAFFPMPEAQKFHENLLGWPVFSCLIAVTNATCPWETSQSATRTTPKSAGRDL